MNKQRVWLAMGAVVLGLSTAGAAPAFAGNDGWNQMGTTDDVHSLVGRTQSDLHQAQATDRDKGKQRERYRNALKHLSDFDKHLSKGKFDKDTLDSAINDIKNVLDHNTLDAGSRDGLTQDIEDLRAARQHR